VSAGDAILIAFAGTVICFYIIGNALQRLERRIERLEKK